MTCSMIYLMRVSDEKSWRQLINRSEVRELYQRCGFKLIQMTDFSLIKQIELMANASHVVVEGGADSFITIFCPPKTKIIELLPSNFLNGFGPLTTSVCLDQKYERVAGKRLKDNKGTTLIDNDYVVNLKDVEKSIDMIV